MTALVAAELLSGPRGRRLCWESLGRPQLRRRPFAPDLVDPVGSIEQVPRGLAGDPIDGEHLLDALRATVDAAHYWQPPDEDDDVLATPEVIAALTPVAENLLAGLEARHRTRRPLADPGLAGGGRGFRRGPCQRVRLPDDSRAPGGGRR